MPLQPSMPRLYPRPFASGIGLVTVLGRRRRTRGFDLELDINRTGLLEDKRRREFISLLQGLLEIVKHQMESARLELYALAGRDLQPFLDLAHGHDSVLDGRLVNFHLAGNRRRC